ncbi:hypothetical protein GO986_12710 [Deinococcus sp. HMF7620]|uniref:Uncharacterized protein n=1 Tax=Deinococcus arboris TaxID=2682977 RepID=A0A7C9HZC1_9DEIO|nr:MULTISPECIES: hypothetical protein [Deinococcus]MBZ9752716.1 hypothetical protein [Deinococcus betulae]MVN87628.1 hypothetical protein [Deinococcus arboris]
MITPALLASLEALVDDLWLWGPKTVGACHEAYGADALRLATKREMVTRRQVLNSRVIVLTGRGLYEFGYTKRYNYLPALTTLKASLVYRYALHQLQTQGYTDPEPYSGYAAGLQNMAALKRGDETVVVIGRSELTLRTMYNVLNHFESLEATEKPTQVLFYVLATKKEPAPGRKVIKGSDTAVVHVSVEEIRAVEREL